MNGNTINLIGQKFGRLTVIDIGDSQTHHPKWKCVCECGTTKEIAGQSLRSGVTKSCGCYRRTQNIRLRKRQGQAGLTAVYNAYKTRAEAKNHQIISIEEFEILSKQNCHYCGSMPFAVRAVRRKTGPYSNPELQSHSEYCYNGLDRIDSSLGYESSNVVPCCQHCNRAKLDLSYTEFISLIKAIYSNLGLDGR